jgi:hypothetical protein
MLRPLITYQEPIDWKYYEEEALKNITTIPREKLIADFMDFLIHEECDDLTVSDEELRDFADMNGYEERDGVFYDRHEMKVALDTLWHG